MDSQRPCKSGFFVTYHGKIHLSFGDGLPAYQGLCLKAAWLGLQQKACHEVLPLFHQHLKLEDQVQESQFSKQIFFIVLPLISWNGKSRQFSCSYNIVVRIMGLIIRRPVFIFVFYTISCDTVFVYHSSS